MDTTTTPGTRLIPVTEGDWAGWLRWPGPDPFEDLAVLGGDRLRPDLVDPGLAQREHGEDAGLDVAADGHDGPVEAGAAHLAQRFLVGRVRLHDMGEVGGPALHELGILVDRHDLLAHVDERQRDGGAETAEPDDEDRVHLPAVALLTQHVCSLIASAGGPKAGQPTMGRSSGSE